MAWSGGSSKFQGAETHLNWGSERYDEDDASKPSGGEVRYLPDRPCDLHTELAHDKGSMPSTTGESVLTVAGSTPKIEQRLNNVEDYLSPVWSGWGLVE